MRRNNNILSKILFRIAKMIEVIAANDFTHASAQQALNFFKTFIGYAVKIELPKKMFNFFTMDDSAERLEKTKSEIKRLSSECESALKQAVSSQSPDGFQNSIYAKSDKFDDLIDAIDELKNILKANMSKNAPENVMMKGTIDSANHFIWELTRALALKNSDELKEIMATHHFNKQHSGMRVGRRMRSRRKLASIGII